MLRSLYLTGVYLFFFVFGFQAPFILTLGYVWVDLFKPNYVAYEILSQIPASLIMACGAIGSYLLLDRKYPPRANCGIILTLCFATWITLTSLWAVADTAWDKWNWAFKTVMFSAFVPLVIRTRTQIEAFIAAYAFSMAANVIPVGAKTLISGGGYGRALGLVADNSGFAEGSTLAALSASLIPILFYLKDHGSLVPRLWIVKAMYWVLIVLCIACTIGTYERTGLIGLGVVGLFLWFRSRRKILLGTLILLAISFGGYFTSDAWQARMQTISDPANEESALTRILVWKWTWDFAQSHPFGGGFNAYVADVIVIGDVVVHGRAFHSIYFEVLGEQGYPGLVMFLSLMLISAVYLRNVTRVPFQSTSLQWSASLAPFLLVSQIVLMVCGSFIGIAFQPPLYYMFSLSFCLYEYARRIREAKPDPDGNLAQAS